jgi:hypothetical protein
LNGFEGVAGLVLVFVSGGLMLFFALRWRERPKPPLRVIPAFLRLRQSTGLTVEDGKRIHVSLGNMDILSPTAASALVGLSTLERIAQLGMISDRPPIATSGDGSLAILSQDSLRYAYRNGNAIERYDASLAQLSGVTPFSFAAGTLPVIHKDDVLTNIFVGNFGPEVALLNDAAERKASYSLAASNSLPAQAVMYPTAVDTLIGEELFAIPAYLNAGPFQRASLQIQDILRWILIAVLVGGGFIKIIETLLGISIL